MRFDEKETSNPFLPPVKDLQFDDVWSNILLFAKNNGLNFFRVFFYDDEMINPKLRELSFEEGLTKEGSIV